MAKSGLLKDLGLGLGGAALLGTGLGAAGIGPLAGVFGAGEAAGAGAGLAEAGTAAATAGELGSGLSSEALLAAPFSAGEAVTSAATPLAAGSTALTAAGDVTGLAGALPAATTLAGSVLPSTSDVLGTAGGLTGPAAGETSNLFTLASEGAAETGAPATNLSLSNLAGLSGDSGFQGSSNLNALAGQTGESGFFTGAGDTKDWWDKTTDWFGRNQGWLKPAVAGAGLATSIGRDTGTIPGSAPVTAAAKDATTQAGFLTGQANQNLGALNTGALPAGAQSAIDSATRNAKASVRSQYAAMGMHTPPAALAAVDEQAGALKLAEAEKLTTLGAKEAGLAGTQQEIASLDYGLLMKESVQQNKDLADSIARFAAALA